MALSYPLAFPTARSTANISLRRFNVIGGNFSAPSLAGQTYRWGGNRWELTMTFPKMPRAVFAQWDAFLTGLESSHGSFIWGPPRYTAPLGAVSGSPVVSSLTADRAQTVPVSGGTGTLLKGSMISMGSGLTRRMYLVNADVNLAGGNMEIWPSLRGQASAGTAIALTNPSCLFHLALGSHPTSNEDEAGRQRFDALTAWEDLR